jgi:hypothetical protein
MEPQPQTIADVESIAARSRIAFEPSDYEKAQSLMDARKRQLAQSSEDRAGAAGFVDRFNRFYPRFLKALIALGDVMISLTQTIMIAFFVPLLLVSCPCSWSC